MNKRPDICASWNEIIKLHGADNLAEYISKLEPLRKIFDDTWIKQQSQKKKAAHLVYNWLVTCQALKPLDRLFLMGNFCSILNQLPGDAGRKNDAFRRLRYIDAHWCTFLSAEFEIFAIALSTLLTNAGFCIKEVYGDVNGSNVELILGGGGVPVYIEAKAMQEPKESIERQRMADSFQQLFSKTMQSTLNVSMSVNFKKILSEDEINILVDQIVGILNNCSIPSSHNLETAVVSVRKGGGFGMGFPFFNRAPAIYRIQKRFNEAQGQIDKSGVGIVWIKLNEEEDVHSQVDKIINAFQNEEYPHIAAVVFCNYEHWKCDESSLHVNPFCKADQSTVKQITKGLQNLLSTPWETRYDWVNTRICT